MTEFEKLIKTLQDKAVADAMAIDPAFAARVAAEKKEIEDHDKMLEAQRQRKSPPPIPAELRRPKEEPEPGESEREILERVNRAVIERRSL